MRGFNSQHAIRGVRGSKLANEQPSNKWSSLLALSANITHTRPVCFGESYKQMRQFGLISKWMCHRRKQVELMTPVYICIGWHFVRGGYVLYSFRTFLLTMFGTGLSDFNCNRLSRVVFSVETLCVVSRWMYTFYIFVY